MRGKKAFVGLGVITEGYHIDDTPLFEGGLKLELLPQDLWKDTWWFLDDVGFCSDKARWSASLVEGIRWGGEMFRREFE